MTKSNYLLIVPAAFLIGCFSDSSVKTINYGDHTAEGNIEITDHDTIFNGVIIYRDAKSRKVTSEVNYVYNARQGVYKEYHQNGTVAQHVNYSNDKENGFADVFDSTGKLTYRTYFYYGMEVGPSIKFANDTFAVYRFNTFEGSALYRNGWDSDHQITEQGRLLNYVTTIVEDKQGMQLSIFLYLISPPHKQIKYFIFDKDTRTGDSTLVFQSNSNMEVFQKVLLPYPGNGHEYFWKVQAFYPKENITLEDILQNDEKKMKLPLSID